MRRLSFQKIAATEEDSENEQVEEENEVFSQGEGDYYYNKIAVMEVESAPMRRRSFQRSSSVLSSALSLVSFRKSFSYDKLSQVPIQLTVVKLDASSFEIDVRKMATIAELKEAVERKFRHLPTKGPGKVSWRHVWGHFCLSFHGQKLLHDSDFIKDYGIKDGDQKIKLSTELVDVIEKIESSVLGFNCDENMPFLLCNALDVSETLRFVRHVSIAYNLIKKRLRKRIEAPKPITIVESNEEDSQKSEVYDDLEDLRCQQNKYEVDENSAPNECMISHLFRGWFLYSKLSSREDTRFEDDTGASRWASGFVGCFRSLFPFCDNTPPAQASRVSQVDI